MGTFRRRHGWCLRPARRPPTASRPHTAAIYAFARIADDFADEGDASTEARLARLDDWRERLHAAAEGRPTAGDNVDAAQVFTALSETMAVHSLDVTLFDDLLS